MHRRWIDATVAILTQFAASEYYLANQGASSWMIKPLRFDKSDPRSQEYWIQPRGSTNGGKMAKRSSRIVTKLANRPKKGPRDIIY